VVERQACRAPPVEDMRRWEQTEDGGGSFGAAAGRPREAHSDSTTRRGCADARSSCPAAACPPAGLQHRRRHLAAGAPTLLACLTGAPRGTPRLEASPSSCAARRTLFSDAAPRAMSLVTARAQEQSRHPCALGAASALARAHARRSSLPLRLGHSAALSALPFPSCARVDVIDRPPRGVAASDEREGASAGAVAGPNPLLRPRELRDGTAAVPEASSPRRRRQSGAACVLLLRRLVAADVPQPHAA
jgi:hypothetical protein